MKSQESSEPSPPHGPDPASTDPPIDPIEDLIAECLERMEVEGEKAVESVCRRYPEQARAVRPLRVADFLLDAHLAVREKDLPRAFSLLREGRNRWPDSPHFPYTLGLMFESQHRFQEAIDGFSEAVKRDPGYAEALMHRGYRHFRLRKLAKAAGDFQAALEVRPHYPWAIHGKAETLQQSGKKDEAMDLVDEALRRNPRNALLLNARGYLHSLNRNTAEAVRDLEAAVRRDPELSYPYFNLANLLHRNGRRDEALRWLEQALGKNLTLRGRIEILNSRATLLWMADPVQVEADLLKGLEIMRSPLLFGNLALFYINQYRFAEAIPMLSEQMSTGYDPEFALARRGFCRWMLLDAEGGIRDQDRALEQLAAGGKKVDRHAWPHSNRARAAAGAGNLEAARRFAREGVKRGQRSREDWYEVVRFRMMAGDAAGVKECLARVTFEEPYGKLVRAWILAKSGKYEEAFRLLPQPDPGIAAWKWTWPSPLPWLAIRSAGQPGSEGRVRDEARAILAGTADSDSVTEALSAVQDVDERVAWQWIAGHYLLLAGRSKEALLHLVPAAAKLSWPQAKTDLGIALEREGRSQEAVEAFRALPRRYRVRAIESMARHGVGAGDPAIDEWLRSGPTPVKR